MMIFADIGPNSDFDLLAVVSGSAPTDRRRSLLAYEVLRGTGTAVDVLVWSQKVFKSRSHLNQSTEDWYTSSPAVKDFPARPERSATKSKGGASNRAHASTSPCGLRSA